MNKFLKSTDKLALYVLFFCEVLILFCKYDLQNVTNRDVHLVVTFSCQTKNEAKVTKLENFFLCKHFKATKLKLFRS